MFLLCINDIDDNIESQIRVFAEDTILYTVIEGMGDASLLQKVGSRQNDRLVQSVADVV